MYLYWCNECDWEERMDKHKYNFCPKCDHVNISRNTLKVSDKVKECAFCKCDVDLSRRKNFEHLEDGEICCSICFERESDTGE